MALVDCPDNCMPEKLLCSNEPGIRWRHAHGKGFALAYAQTHWLGPAVCVVKDPRSPHEDAEYFYFPKINTAETKREADVIYESMKVALDNAP